MSNPKAIKKQFKARRAASARSEEKYRALVESTGTGYLILDDKGSVVDANREYLRLTGRKTFKEILGHRVTEWTARHDRARNAREVRKCIEQGCVRNLCLDYIRPDGAVTPVEINANIIRAGASFQIVSLCRDITERKKTERALMESEEKYRVLVEGTNDIVYANLPNGKLSYISPQISRYGWRPDELVGKSFLRAIANEDRKRMAAKHMKSVRKGRELVSEFRGLTKSGNIVWFADNGKVQRDERGHITGVTGVLMDITARKKAEMRLNESEERYRTIFDEARDSILLLEPRPDAAPVIRDANPTALRLHGYSRKTLLGKPITFLDADSSDADIREWVKRLLKTGSAFFDVKHRTRDGHVIDLEASVRKIRLGGKVFFFDLSRDITEHKRLEMELAVARATKVLNTVASPIAHDFNNVISAINGYAALVYEDMPNSNPAKREIKQILKAVGRAAKISDRLQSLTNTPRLDREV